MALHQTIQRLLLVGVRLESFPPLPPAELPDRLKPIVAAAQPEHQKFDQRALHFGHRYRSGFWAIYLLSAIAVLFAVMPLALGWEVLGEECGRSDHSESRMQFLAFHEHWFGCGVIFKAHFLDAPGFRIVVQ